MRIKYNAPVVLSFTFICTAVLLLCQALPWLTDWFAVPGRAIDGQGGFHFNSVRNWFTLFTHAIGHANWAHLISNFSMILLIGPILEESYGSFWLFLMMFVTALVTGILNVLIFPAGLMGASGIVFMMILLASFTNFGKGEIPLTFILVLVLYLGQEIYQAFGPSDNISQFAHIIGGLCGSFFGFSRQKKSFKDQGSALIASEEKNQEKALEKSQGKKFLV
jgi:membrane associated rhomboid family serine protease